METKKEPPEQLFSEVNAADHSGGFKTMCNDRT
jgi:hypothetical protein